MANRIRYLVHCFSNRGDAMGLVSKLKNFKASVNRDIELSSDDRGGAKKLRHQIVDSNLPDSFTVYVPIIKGSDKRSIRVEIFANESLEVTLFSYDIIETIQGIKEEIIRSEIDRIRESFPQIPVIEV